LVGDRSIPGRSAGIASFALAHLRDDVPIDEVVDVAAEVMAAIELDAFQRRPRKQRLQAQFGFDKALSKERAFRPDDLLVNVNFK
jgi:hypothetical protein